MNKSQVPTLTIPEIIYKFNRDVIVINTNFNITTPSPFSKSNLNYVLNIKRDPKRKSRNFSLGSGFFNKLSVAGPLTINFDDFDDIKISFRNEKPTTANENYYYNDYIDCLSLSLNHSNQIEFDLSEDKHPEKYTNLKEIKINSKKFNVRLSNLHNLEKITLINSENDSSQTINRYNYWMRNNHVFLENLPNLKELNLPNLDFFTTSNLKLINLPPNCVLSLNPNLQISYTSMPILRANSLKGLCSALNDYESTHHTVYLSEILNLSNNNNPLKITFKDFSEKINAFADKQIQKQYKINTNKENKQVQKIR